MYNRIVLQGRLTKEPECGRTVDSTPYARFSLANKWDFTNDITSFYNCKAYGKLAETIKKHCFKGQMVILEGKIDIVKGNDGKYYNRVMADSIDIIEWKDDKSPENLDELSDEGIPF